MKQLVALVKPFRAQAVVEALGRLGVEAVTVSEAKGYGRQKDQLPLYRNTETPPVYLPKIEIQVLLPEESVESAVEAIVTAARTGRIGDGKIMILPVVAGIDL
ncbi:MAG: P-II family nitrogen regulator [Planctomycetia bacterium]